MTVDRRQALRSGRAFVVLLLVIAGLIGWAILRSPLFGLRDLRISGNTVLDRSDVLRLAGVAEGDNLLLDVSTGDVRAGLERHPWVADASVQRRLPSTLVVMIREREPVGWVGSGRGGVVLAADGTVLERVERRPPGLPTVGRMEQPPHPGGVAPGLRTVLRVAASLPPALRREVAAAVEDRGLVTLRLRAGGRVLYGPPSSVGEKNQAIVSMLEWAEERRVAIDYVDVRVPGAPVLRAAGRG